MRKLNFPNRKRPRQHQPEQGPPVNIVFLDIETTGLDVDRHEVWEFGAIQIDSTAPFGHYNEVNILWRPGHLEDAEPGAINVNHYYDRTYGMRNHTKTADRQTPDIDTKGKYFSDPYEVAWYIAWMLEGALIVGNNPGFDEKFLTKFCKEQSHVLANFHRKINVVDLALGKLCTIVKEGHHDPDVIAEAIKATQLPHSSRKVLDAAGCPKNENPHTALGDARHVMAAFYHLWGFR